MRQKTNAKTARQNRPPIPYQRVVGPEREPLCTVTGDEFMLDRSGFPHRSDKAFRQGPKLNSRCFPQRT
jgi:hypothetical protein